MTGANDRCEGCGQSDVSLRSIRMVNGPRQRLCRDCFETAVEVGEVHPDDPRVDTDPGDLLTDGGTTDSHRIPFEHTTAIKARLSGLSQGSAGNGRARDTVNHLFVKEAFEEGRLSRESDTYLCDPNATPRFPSGEGEHDENRQVTCQSCLDLMERWEVAADAV